MNRRTRTIGPDGMVQDTEVYDGAGRVLAQTDALVRTTTFGYDLVG